MAEAQEAYLAAVEALQAESGGRPIDKTKLPADRRPELLRKMDALAEATLGKQGGVDVAAGAFMWSWELDVGLDHLAARFGRLVEHYANDPVLDDVLPVVGAASERTGKPDDWVASLERLVTRTTRSEAKLLALVALGRVQLGASNLADAKAAFARLVKIAPGSDSADEAKGYIFEIDHLQVGMAAPDFVAETLTGELFSLRSLGGKVVLLNFWATW